MPLAFPCTGTVPWISGQRMQEHLDAVKIRSRTHDIVRTLRLVVRVAPFWTTLSLILVAVQGLLPLAALYLMKMVVDTVAAGVKGQGNSHSVRDLVLWVVLAGCVALLVALCRSLAAIVNEAQSHYVTQEMSDLVHRQSVMLDLSHFENPGYRDMMHRAQEEAPYRPLAILTGMTQIGQAAVSLLGIAGLLITFNVPLTLVLLLCAMPGALLRLFFSRRIRDIRRQQTQSERLSMLYHYYLIMERSAKEVKLFHLGHLFRERYRDLRTRLRAGRLAITRRREYADFLGQGFATVALFGSLGYIALATLRGAIGLGAMVMYYQAFQTGLGQLQVLLRSAADLIEHSLFLENFYQFLDLKPAIVAEAPRQPAPVRPAQGVRFHDVCFRYPGRTEYALRDINLEIKAGQVIALVGPNGSGKTTIAKLVPRLYDPTSGRITVDGIDLRHLEPEDWQRRVSVVFQDFLQYPLSALDNIWLGDISRKPELAGIREAARASGVDELVEKLPRGYDTILGNEYTGGHELSGGEWQKIAVARAFFREAALAILDEPTSALDPRAEAELFRKFRTLIEGKSAVLISHRFSTVQMADYIYVLDEGSVIEQGTHQELLRLDGTYAQLYHVQAERFLQTNAEPRSAEQVLMEPGTPVARESAL